MDLRLNGKVAVVTGARPFQDRMSRLKGRPCGVTTMAHGVKLHPDFDRSNTAEIEAHRLYEDMAVHVVDWREAFPTLAAKLREA